MKNNENQKALEMFDQFKQKKVNDQDIHDAEAKAKNLGKIVKDFRLLIAMFKDGISGVYSISGLTLATLAGAILYVVSPIDAVPDFIPFVGWLDDVAVITFVLANLNSEISKYKKFKKIE
ncbi:DUF1232 domain-containing protein [Flavobacterium agricola]|uniref:DUF1232 domain-containing protein n=1 Tax=Flavobacterium agricola TaxID=2870839 RepID=A0ABY6M248_9FLAO|nr:DUF1232 domain-containing protein [Flavobacterium agricola]